MPLCLREGIQLDSAVNSLRECLTRFQNLRGGGPTGSTDEVQRRYVSEIEAIDVHLRNVFTDPDIWNHLYGDRYWAIRSMTSATVRPIPLIDAEVQDQTRHVEGLMDRVVRLKNRLAAAPGQITMLDTNVLLHYLPPSQVDWSEVVHQEAARLILPLRVVEELDMRKYQVRDDLADRARRLLSELWRILAPTAGAPVALPGRPGVTIEVPVDDEPRQRPLDADTEILDECSTLRAVGKPATLVTGDTGISIRAVARKIDVVVMPEKYLRRKPAPNDEPGGI